MVEQYSGVTRKRNQFKKLNGLTVDELSMSAFAAIFYLLFCVVGDDVVVIRKWASLHKTT